MISAPARTSETLSSKPTVKTQGHLALLEWDEQPTPNAPVHTNTFSDPIRRTVMDRCYDGGVLVLLTATMAALAASLGRF